MEKSYAQALWNMIEGGMAPKRAVAALQEALVVRGRQDLMPRIANAFARLAQREQAKHDIVLTVAHEKDEAWAKRQAKEALDEMKASTRDVSVQIDDTLIGGWRLEGQERLVDASFKKQLLSLYNRTTQA